MKLSNMNLLWAVSALLVAAAKADNHLCRCEASWEDFYGRRLEDQDTTPRHRELYHHYNYRDAHWDGSNHMVIEGVVVLPWTECVNRRLQKDTSPVQSHALAPGMNFSTEVVMVAEQSSAKAKSQTSRNLQYQYGTLYCWGKMYCDIVKDLC
jgi:hypothetical protein